MSEYVFLNEQLVDSDTAHISVHDAGLLHGVGLFETMRSYHRWVFRLADHLDRLFASAAALGIAITQDRTDIVTAIGRLLEANNLQEARLRLTVTRGSIRNSSINEPVPSTLLITAGVTEPYPLRFYEKGMTIILSNYKQNVADPMAGHKTLNYFSRLLALQQAQQQNAGEALWFTPTNCLAEGCISNVFVVDGHRLLTPPTDTPVLPGIVRKVVLELAETEGIEYEERPLYIKDLLGASEVFLTNSIMELMPVCRIERHVVGDDKPGPIYKQLHQLYCRTVEAEHETQ